MENKYKDANAYSSHEKISQNLEYLFLIHNGLMKPRTYTSSEINFLRENYTYAVYTFFIWSGDKLEVEELSRIHDEKQA